MLTAGREWRLRLPQASGAPREEAPASDDPGAVAGTPEPATHATAAAADTAAAAGEEPMGADAALVGLFADCAGAPFSIHKIVLEGAVRGSASGSWLGPASI